MNDLINVWMFYKIFVIFKKMNQCISYINVFYGVGEDIENLEISEFINYFILKSFLDSYEMRIMVIIVLFRYFFWENCS